MRPKHLSRQHKSRHLTQSYLSLRPQALVLNHYSTSLNHLLAHDSTHLFFFFFAGFNHYVF